MTKSLSESLDESHREDDMSAKTVDESESLSDIDDLEVDGYLNNEEEKHYKKIIWEEMNWEYLKEQAAKEAAAADAKEGFENILAARKLATSAAASMAKSKKGRKQRQTQETKNSDPAQSAAEATHQMLRKKRLSSKVNFEILKKIYDEPAALENPKKARFEPCSDNHDNLEPELEDKNKGDEQGSMDEFEDSDDRGRLYENTASDENVDEIYDYDEDDYSYDGF